MLGCSPDPSFRRIGLTVHLEQLGTWQGISAFASTHGVKAQEVMGGESRWVGVWGHLYSWVWIVDVGIGMRASGCVGRL